MPGITSSVSHLPKPKFSFEIFFRGGRKALVTLSAGAGEAAGMVCGIAGLEMRLWGCWGSQPSVPALRCVSLGWMAVWDSRSGGPAWLPWWLNISSKLTSNYMVNGITVKSSSLSSPGLNAPLGQRHLMALWAGSKLGAAFGSQPLEVTGQRLFLLSQSYSQPTNPSKME